MSAPSQQPCCFYFENYQRFQTTYCHKLQITIAVLFSLHSCISKCTPWSHDHPGHFMEVGWPVFCRDLGGRRAERGNLETLFTYILQIWNIILWFTNSYYISQRFPVPYKDSLGQFTTDIYLVISQVSANVFNIWSYHFTFKI